MTMRVAMIGPVPETWGGPPRGGGVSSYIQGLASAVADLGTELFLLGDNTNAALGPLQAHPPTHIRFSPMFRLAGRSVPRALPVLGSGRLVRMMIRLLMQRDIGIPWLQCLRYSDRAANYDLFLHQVQPQLVHVAHAEFRQFLSQRIAGNSPPLIASVLSATVLLRPTPDWLVRMTTQNYNRAACLIACSNFVKETIGPHVDNPDKLVVIPNGTDAERFRPTPQAKARAALDLNPNEFIVLYTGSLVVPKGVDVLLRAFASGLAQHANTRLVFVGAGPQAKPLENLATQLGVAHRVTLAGYRPVEELPNWYAACDVFALPSQSEGLSISVLEAMASGRPVITTPPDIGDHDAVEDNVNGLLCPYGDVDALAMGLGALAQSPDRVQQMGAVARRKVERCFSWPVVARQIVDVYARILAEVDNLP